MEHARATKTPHHANATPCRATDPPPRFPVWLRDPPSPGLGWVAAVRGVAWPRLTIPNADAIFVVSLFARPSPRMMVLWCMAQSDTDDGAPNADANVHADPGGDVPPDSPSDVVFDVRADASPNCPSDVVSDARAHARTDPVADVAADRGADCLTDVSADAAADCATNRLADAAANTDTHGVTNVPANHATNAAADTHPASDGSTDFRTDNFHPSSDGHAHDGWTNASSDVVSDRVSDRASNASAVAASDGLSIARAELCADRRADPGALARLCRRNEHLPPPALRLGRRWLGRRDVRAAQLDGRFAIRRRGGRVRDERHAQRRERGHVVALPGRRLLRAQPRRRRGRQRDQLRVRRRARRAHFFACLA